MLSKQGDLGLVTTIVEQNQKKQNIFYRSTTFILGNKKIIFEQTNFQKSL